MVDITIVYFTYQYIIIFKKWILLEFSTTENKYNNDINNTVLILVYHRNLSEFYVIS